MFLEITSKTHRYGFNGKELDTEGMGGGLSTYDYGFRIYNPAICKFLSVDPLMASYPWYTPYQFAGNTPIRASDLDGLEPKEEGKEGEVATTLGDGNKNLEDVLNGDGKSMTIQNTPMSVISGGASGYLDIPLHSFADWIKHGSDWKMISFFVADQTNNQYGKTFYYDSELNWFKAEDGTEWERSYSQGLLNTVGSLVEGLMIASDNPKEFFDNAVNDLKLSAIRAAWDPASSVFEAAYEPIADLMAGGVRRQNFFIGMHLGISLSGPLGVNGNFAAKGVPQFKWLRDRGGDINGFTISQGSGYGARPRFDFHKLSNTYNSRATSTMTIPKWLDGKKLPHWHSGKGSNLRYHRPWEVGPDGKRRW